MAIMPRLAPGAPNLDEFADIAREAAEAIPAPFAQHLKNVVITVKDLCDDDTKHELGLLNPFDLLGLYRGVPLSKKSVLDPVDDVDVIYLYRRPILKYWRQTDEDLKRIIRHVLIHEAGHHFGFSDDEMTRIEREE